MRLTRVRGEVGTSRTLSPWITLSDHDSDLLSAVETEHPCEDSACDVAAALAQGFGHVAAWLLSSATECPTVAVVHRAHELNGTAEPFRWGDEAGQFGEWLAWHREHGRQCGSCGAFNYDVAPGDSCGACLATFPEDSEEEE